MKRKISRGIALLCAMMLMSGAAAEPVAGTETSDPVGVDMLAVDHRLYELGYRDAACNGVLDEVTTNALRNFQTANNLEANGEANDLTVAILLGDNAISQSQYLKMLAQENAQAEPLTNGAFGEPVLRLQMTLKELGFFHGLCDGAYGQETAAAVCRFQLANGLKESGIADGTLFSRLYDGECVRWDTFLQESCASVGDSGSHVRRLQLWLKEKGYFSGECTGRYGDGTQRAVKRFQDDLELESSGNADLAVCEALYWNINAHLQDKAALRRGEGGPEAELLCSNLALLGYPAHGRFSMQTELALMQFQLANGLPVTGVADEETRSRLNSDIAIALQDYAVGAGEIDAEGMAQKLARRAQELLGQYSELDSSFGFVQYVALQCGMELMNRSQLARVDVGPVDTVEAGAFLVLQSAGREIWGIAVSNGAMIYRADNGYIVMGYLAEMNTQGIGLYHLIENA